jgi:hypothetical protein
LNLPSAAFHSRFDNSSVRFQGPPKEATVFPDPVAQSDAVAEVRDLARSGGLAAAVAVAAPARRVALVGAAYAVAWPVVFTRLTMSVELHRGHHACARSVGRMTDDCLDRFHDDVEAVVEDVITHATKPIRNLEAWIASRLTAATVDGHRRQRGRRGALQRPRLPKWLSEGLGHDVWLSDLALQVLIWVGVPAAAGAGLWPLDTWVQRRAAVKADWTGSDQSVVAREVDAVLAVMRSHERWYTDHVERPLGRKRAPLALAYGTGDEFPVEPPPLALVDPDELDDAWLTGLATYAVELIAARLGLGEDPREVVTEVLDILFGGYHSDRDIGRLPHERSLLDERVDALLQDPAEVDRIVVDVLGIIEPGGIGGLVRSA